MKAPEVHTVMVVLILMVIANALCMAGGIVVLGFDQNWGAALTITGLGFAVASLVAAIRRW